MDARKVNILATACTLTEDGAEDATKHSVHKYVIFGPTIRTNTVGTNIVITIGEDDYWLQVPSFALFDSLHRLVEGGQSHHVSSYFTLDGRIGNDDSYRCNVNLHKVKVDGTYFIHMDVIGDTNHKSINQRLKMYMSQIKNMLL